MSQSSSRKARVNVTVTCKPTKQAGVPLPDMQSRLESLVGENSKIALGSIIQNAIQEGILRQIASRFPEADDFTPIIDRGRTFARRREALRNLQANLARQQEQLARLTNPATATYQKLQKAISKTKARIARIRGGREAEDKLTGVTDRKAAAPDKELSEANDETFSGRFTIIKHLFTKLDDYHTDLRGGGKQPLKMRYLNIRAMDKTKINARYPRTTGVVGSEATPNSLWRLLEFGSGQFSKSGARLVSFNGSKVEGGRGAWAFGSTIIRGHKPGNVLRDQTMREYGEDEVQFRLEVAKQLEQFLRTGQRTIVR